MTDTWHAKIHPQKILTLCQPEEVHHLDQVRLVCGSAPSSNASTIINMLIPSSDPPPTVKEPPDQAEKNNIVKNTTNGETTQPLAPPPRPAPTQQNTAEEGLDYFSTGHHNSHFSREPNPFEQSFGNPSSEAPANKSLLPPVAALTSPAPLAGEGPSVGGYNWAGSLRSGPLSPAMLGGPVGAGPGDYFDPSLRGSFPSGVTPNESSLRTGLTPGGGGSMFPAPSPNSQAIYQQLASGGATPSTLDFHRTAMNAKAARQGTQLNANGTSQSEDKRAPVASMDPSLQQQSQQPTFGQHDNDAANGLFLLAQAGNGTQMNNQYAMPNTAQANMTNSRSHETSPTMAKGARNNGSIGGQSEMSNDISDSGDGKPATRSRGKRSSSGKNGTTNGKRKTEDTPAKQTSAKKQKNMSVDMDGMDSDDEQPNIKEEQYHADGKKMTDEEKRKNFLERNRCALLPCEIACNCF